MSLSFKRRAQLKLNYKFFLDHHFLREGCFSNVGSGQMFYDGNDMSLLLPDTEAHKQLVGVGVGQVWQSPFREWIYESGVPIDGTNVVVPPTLASGIFVEGAFRAANDPTFGHTIDYLNGRIIFNNPQSLGLKVQAEFAYREVRIDFEHRFNQQARDGLLESQYMTNPLTSMQIVYPSGNAYPFPAIFIEVDRRTAEPYELGNRSLVTTDTVNLHIWALDDMTRDNIVDVLTGQDRKSVPLIDFNKMPLPLSGILNAISPEYHPYQELVRNNVTVTTVGSGVPIRLISYIDESVARNMPADEEYEKAMVQYQVVTYLNAPTTPLGHVFSPIRELPPLGDTAI
jgi:hypothetical protein